LFEKRRQVKRVKNVRMAGFRIKKKEMVDKNSQESKGLCEV
jgi:hypothetical protein